MTSHGGPSGSKWRGRDNDNWYSCATAERLAAIVRELRSPNDPEPPTAKSHLYARAVELLDRHNIPTIEVERRFSGLTLIPETALETRDRKAAKLRRYHDADAASHGVVVGTGPPVTESNVPGDDQYQVVDGDPCALDACFSGELPKISSIRLVFFTTIATEDLGSNHDSTLLRTKRDNGTIDPYSLTSNHEYTISPLGRDYDYCGRGPVWHWNSCALDAVLVAGRVLWLDSANTATVHDPSQNKQWEIDQLWRDTIGQPWQLMSRQAHIDARSPLLQAMRTLTCAQQGHFLPAARLWESAAAATSDTLVRGQCTWHCTACNKKRSQAREMTATRMIDLVPMPTVGPRQSRHSMADLLRYFLGPRLENHDGCTSSRGLEKESKQVSSLKVTGQLPRVLAVRPFEGYEDVLGGTDPDLTFHYDSDGGKRRVSYCWMTSICCRQNHFRVYMDHSRGGGHSGYLMIYDSMKLSGAIIGGVPPAHSRHKVPEWWAAGTVFYVYTKTRDDPVEERPAEDPKMRLQSRGDIEMTGIEAEDTLRRETYRPHPDGISSDELDIAHPNRSAKIYSATVPTYSESDEASVEVEEIGEVIQLD